MKEKPQKLDYFISLLNEGNSWPFIHEFKKLASDSEKIETLAYDFQKLRQLAEMTLSHDDYELHIVPHLPALQQSLFHEVFTFAKEKEISSLLQAISLFPIHERVKLLDSGSESSLYQIILAIFPIESILEILKLLPSKIEGESQTSLVRIIEQTHQIYDQDKNKAKVLLGELFLRAPPSLCTLPGMSARSVYMVPDDFIPFLESQPPENLIIMYFRISELSKKDHLLYSLLKYQGLQALEAIFQFIPKHHQDALAQELTKMIGENQPLYDQLISIHLQEGYPSHYSLKCDIHVIRLINGIIPDRTRAQLLLSSYSKLSAVSVYNLLSLMEPNARLQVLLSRISEQPLNLLIEEIAHGSVHNPDHFLNVINIVDKFAIFTQPVKYGVLKAYLQNEVAATFSNVANLLPFVPSRARNTLQSLQTDRELFEFLLSRLLRENAFLVKCLPEILSGLTPSQLATLMRESDSIGQNLTMYLFREQDLEIIIQLFSKAEYSIDDDKKIFDPKKIDFRDYRQARGQREAASALIGFLGLLIIYQYVSTREFEMSGEFPIMIKLLQSNRHNPEIKQRLQAHYRDYPLRGAWGIPLATTSIKLGSNKPQEARNKLLECETNELQEGVDLFKKFIALRQENPAVLALDRHLYQVLNGSSYKKTPAVLLS